MKQNVWKNRIAAVIFFLFFFLIGVPSLPASAATPKLSAKKLEIAIGTDAKLKVSHAGKKKITWKTSNSKIVSIKKTSSTSVKLMAGKKKGSATVTVKVAKKTLKCKVKVVDWHFSATNGTKIGVGESTTFKFYGVSAKKFSSSNPKVAKVSQKGKISGLKKGSCYIYYNVGRIRYKTQITVVKKLRPDMQIGTHIYADGGSWNYVRATAKAGKSATLNIANSKAGCYHSIFFFANNSNRWEGVTSGLKVSSSKPSVLSYVGMAGDYAVFYSYQNGTTELKVSYKGNNYKFIVKISDQNSTQYQQIRKDIYRRLGINSGMSRQYICYLLAAWICDNATYDYKRPADRGVNATYKDYFRYGTVVCSGYADLFMYLCAGQNIPCRQVGNTDMNHRWNQVQIDGKWYNIDTCWMDTAENGVYSFEYFLVSDNTMRTFSEGKHLTDPTFISKDTRFDSCIQEQIARQTEINRAASDRPYAAYSYMSPWVTGTWTSY